MNDNVWESVNDRMPEHRRSVLVYCPEYNNIYCGDFRKEDDCIFSKKGDWYYFTQGLGNEITEEVTHWMPLPEPPKETDA